MLVLVNCRCTCIYIMYNTPRVDAAVGVHRGFSLFCAACENPGNYVASLATEYLACL